MDAKTIFTLLIHPERVIEVREKVFGTKTLFFARYKSFDRHGMYVSTETVELWLARLLSQRAGKPIQK